MCILPRATAELRLPRNSLLCEIGIRPCFTVDTIVTVTGEMAFASRKVVRCTVSFRVTAGHEVVNTLLHPSAADFAWYAKKSRASMTLTSRATTRRDRTLKSTRTQESAQTCFAPVHRFRAPLFLTSKEEKSMMIRDSLFAHFTCTICYISPRFQ